MGLFKVTHTSCTPHTTLITSMPFTHLVSPFCLSKSPLSKTQLQAPLSIPHQLFETMAFTSSDSWGFLRSTKEPNITATHKVLSPSVILSEFESCASLRLKLLKAEAIPHTTCMISQTPSPPSYVVLNSQEELRSKFVHLWLKHNLDVKPFFHHHHNLTIPKLGKVSRTVRKWRPFPMSYLNRIISLDEHFTQRSSMGC